MALEDISPPRTLGIFIMITHQLTVIYTTVPVAQSHTYASKFRRTVVLQQNHRAATICNDKYITRRQRR